MFIRFKPLVVFKLYLILNTLDNLITSEIEKESVHKTKPLFKFAPWPIIQCAKAIGVSNSIVSNRIDTGNPLLDKDVIKIRKIRVFN